MANTMKKNLLEQLPQILAEGKRRADFCVGYYNLRGWWQIGSFIERCL